VKLELRQISKTFGPLKANNDINFIFEPGKTYAILGENGAGKSTLMKIIAGYQPPDEGGQLLINDQVVTIDSPLDALQQGVGMLYQDPLDFPPMTVLENYVTARPDVAFLPDWQTARTEFEQIALRFGFSISPDALIESLTIGARQQLEIVRLLSLGVRLLILDEPTTGISEEQRQQLFSTLRQLATEDQMVICIVTHKLEDVEALCDAVLVLRHGRVTGTPEMPVSKEELVRLMFGHPQTPEPRPSVPLGDPVLEVDKLTVRTRLLDVEDISLQVRQGEVIGLAGLDGSGQEAFMRACAGFSRVSWQDHIMSVVTLILMGILFEYVLGYSLTMLTVTMLIVAALTLSPLVAMVIRRSALNAGNVKFRGSPTRWESYRDLREKGLTYLSAGRLEEGLVSGLTVSQHFALVGDGGKAPWVNWFAVRDKTQASIKTYDIRGQAFSPIQTLSGGNQQRVALALLPKNLHLAFLENPTRGLDVNSARNIWNLLLQRRDEGTAIVFSSPDLDEIVEYSDRVMVFSSGKWTMVDHKEDINAHTLGLLIGGGSLSDA